MDNKQILISLKERESELKQIVEQWNNAQLELAGTQKAIKALEEVNNNVNGHNKRTTSKESSVIPYSPELTLKGKINSTLSSIGKGSVHDLVTYILGKEPGLDKDKVYRNVNSTVYLMSKNKEIASRKVGGKKIYRIKE